MHRALLVVLMFGLLESPAGAFSVTLNPGTETSSMAAVAHELPIVTQQVFTPSVIPFVDSASVTQGATSNVSTYDLSDSGFDITFDHTRGPNDPTGQTVVRAQSVGFVYFSLDEDIAYRATAAYTAMDAEGHRMFLAVSLLDVTTGLEIFDSYQESRATPNESFVLGGNGGDFSNRMTGALSGTLVAGHEYRYNYNTIMIADSTTPPAAQSADGAGFATFAFIPEPSTALLVGLGLVGVAMRRRQVAQYR